MNTKEIWDAPTDVLMARLSWLNNDAPKDNPQYDNEYWDIMVTLCCRDEGET